MGVKLVGSITKSPKAGRAVVNWVKEKFKKTSPTIKSINPAKHLTTKRAIQDKVVRAVDEGTRKGLKGATPSPHLKQSMSKSKRDKGKELKDYSYKWDRLVKQKEETKTLIKGAGVTSAAAAGAAGVSLYNKKKKK